MRQFIDIVESAKTHPRVFYRGTNPESTERISTGNDTWDGYLFCADSIKQASNYGRTIERITAQADAKILYEGTRDFIRLKSGIKMNNGMLDWAAAIVSRAKEDGYDAVWFKMQGNVGTVIINQDKFIREPNFTTLL